jgi:hypothetical protein
MRFYTYGGSANSYKAELLLALTAASVRRAFVKA